MFCMQGCAWPQEGSSWKKNHVVEDRASSHGASTAENTALAEVDMHSPKGDMSPLPPATGHLRIKSLVPSATPSQPDP